MAIASFCFWSAHRTFIRPVIDGQYITEDEKILIRGHRLYNRHAEMTIHRAIRSAERRGRMRRHPPRVGETKEQYEARVFSSKH